MPNNTLQDLFFDHSELTASINNAPYTPGLIAEEKLFHEAGIPTTSMFVEYDNGRIDLIPAAPRGGVAQPFRSGQRTGFHVDAVHLPHSGSVLADEVQDRRGFGGVSLETPEQLKGRKLAGMRANMEATIEHLRLGAIKGLILDADGATVIADLYPMFGISQIEKSLSLSVTASQLLNKVIDAERAAEDALRGTKPAGFLAYCAPEFMDALRAHPDYKTELQWARPSELSSDYRSGIRIGNTLFKEYREAFGRQIATGTGYLMPIGIPDLFLTRYAPADWVETVNTPGLPIYAKAQPMPMDRGYFLEAQSNPVSVCTRPASIIKLTAD